MRRSSGGSLAVLKILVSLLVLLVLGYGGYYIYNSNMFEKEPPKINLSNQIYWNLNSAIDLNITDNSGIKSVKIFITDSALNSTTLVDQKLNIPQKTLNLQLLAPKELKLNKNLNYKIGIEVTDISRWNFLRGNKLSMLSDVIVDTKRPEVYTIANSYSIKQGGSATVVFSAKDEMLKEVYIETNLGHKFEAKPFVKDGYYASIIAWPAQQKGDYAAYIIAKDYAGNETKSRIRYYIQNRNYKESTIALTQNFINGKITDLSEIYASDPSKLVGVDKFKFVNETLRNANEKVIFEATKHIKENAYEGLDINRFYPLKNAQVVANYGDHRFYTMNDELVSESWHLGLDLASVANASIVTSNDAEVVMVAQNGIYGLTIVLHHGFGIYTLYGHCSTSSVDVGDKISKGSVIGATGSSGLAFGDHLHFSVIVQGIEVTPIEWMDKKWIKDNVLDIFNSAQKTIQNAG
ncbi:MAG: M23 family metallopeptidase [Campylobacter sp.]|nr:M23 family metallopeptidase [Campylobacter sp.]